MTMTKRHFAYIASTIHALPLANDGQPDGITPAQRQVIARWFAHDLRRTNPLFKVDVFLDACTPQAERDTLVCNSAEV